MLSRKITFFAAIVFRNTHLPGNHSPAIFSSNPPSQRTNAMKQTRPRGQTAQGGAPPCV